MNNKYVYKQTKKVNSDQRREKHIYFWSSSKAYEDLLIFDVMTNDLIKRIFLNIFQNVHFWLWI